MNEIELLQEILNSMKIIESILGHVLDTIIGGFFIMAFLKIFLKN